MKINKSYYIWAIFLVIFLIYILGLPTTVQAGDSGELAAAAWMKLVVHPPGYPLWVWLNHFWMSFFPIGTVFYNAAVLNCIIAIVALIFIFLTASGDLLSAFIVALFAVSKIFWHYSEVPEVFALNCVFAAAILFLYSKFSRTTLMLIPVLYFVGLANHLTIIFMAPFLLMSWWQCRKDFRYYISVGTGLVLCAGLYSSLLALDTNHLYSWGSLKSFEDLWHHFLRTDYGTGRLSAESGEGNFLEVLFLFGKESWMLLAVFLVSVIFSISSKIKLARIPPLFFIAFVTFIGYISIFFSLVNFPLVGFGVDVVERFFIFPQLLIVVCSALLMSKMTEISHRRKYFANGVLCLLILSSIVSNYAINDFSKNTILEDYSLNMLKGIKDNPLPAILIQVGDSDLFAVRYAQLILDPNEKLFVTTMPILIHPWLIQKVRAQFPNFNFDSERISKSKKIFLEQDLLLPNLDSFSFFISKNYMNQAQFKITFFPVGRKIERGSGFSFAKEEPLLLRSDIGLISSPLKDYNVYRDIYAEYAYYNLAKGIVASRESDKSAAAKIFLKAFEFVPYCAPAVKNLCELDKNAKFGSKNCEEELSMLAESYPYF